MSGKPLLGVLLQSEWPLAVDCPQGWHVRSLEGPVKVRRGVVRMELFCAQCGARTGEASWRVDYARETQA